MHVRRASFIHSKWKPSMASDLLPGRFYDKPFSSISKWITIEPADTAPMAISAQRHLRHNESLGQMSIVDGQDQFSVPQILRQINAARSAPSNRQRRHENTCSTEDKLLGEEGRRSTRRAGKPMAPDISTKSCWKGVNQPVVSILVAW